MESQFGFPKSLNERKATGTYKQSSSQVWYYIIFRFRHLQAHKKWPIGTTLLMKRNTQRLILNPAKSDRR